MQCARGAQPVKEVDLERKLGERNISVAQFGFHGIIVRPTLLIAKGSTRHTLAVIVLSAIMLLELETEQAKAL